VGRERVKSESRFLIALARFTMDLSRVAELCDLLDGSATANSTVSPERFTMD
jgi:hypothetical protein